MLNQMYEVSMKADRKSQRTIEAYMDEIEKCLAFIGKPENEITYADLLNWKASIPASLKANSVNHKVYAVRSYFGFLEAEGIIDKNPTTRLKAVKVADVKEKHYMDEAMAKAMIEAARTKRDRAIILTYCATGLRVFELTAITREQYENMGGEDNREIVIIGKGSKRRVIYINDQVKEAIDKYLADRYDDGEYLFSTARGKKIAPGAISDMLKRTAEEAGIDFYEDMSNHALRSCFASIASVKGVSIPVIEKALGHTSSLGVLGRYLKVNQEQVNELMRSMTF